VSELKRKWSSLVVVTVLAVLVAGGALLAQAADFELRRSTIGSGGGISGSAAFRVQGTVGQGVASQPAAASESFRLSSGFWFGAAPDNTVYLPWIDR
jgi:hypothetical protein